MLRNKSKRRSESSFGARLGLGPRPRPRLKTGVAACIATLLIGIAAVGVALGHVVCLALLPLIPLWVSLVSGPRAFYWSVSIISLGPLGALLISSGSPTEAQIAMAVAIGILIRTVQISIVESMQLMKDEAITDPLTGVLNRRGMAERLGTLLPRLRWTGAPLAVFSLDLDEFKALNDRFGHLAGDHALRIMGGVLRDPGLITATVVRAGGDEFLVFFPEVNEEQAGNLAKNLKTEADRRLRRAGYNTSVTIGIAWFKEVPESDREIIGRADEALYALKEERKGKFLKAV